MTDINATITSVLRNATSAKIYWPSHPKDAPLPLVAWTFRRENGLDITHNAAPSNRVSNIVVTCVANTEAGLVALVNQVKTALETNRTNFVECHAGGTQFDNQESDSIFTSIKDYQIKFKL